MSAAAYFRNLVEVNNEVAAFERRTREIEASHRAQLLSEQVAAIQSDYEITVSDDHMLLTHMMEQDDFAKVFRVPGTTDVDRDRTQVGHRTPFLARAFEVVIEQRIEANRRERLAAQKMNASRKAAA
ncbi:hypothetical protein CCAX7_55180 [Capsulimonas corticalis]|uniref:Uncharacterized protein n=1 Tax=Capsulimonas corticalis TaxID=2219043 RepID=A0A402D5M9_9BACT|nr:hypothetical protein [Capsulimonas corticalis]BDI33467.1 hypothetical protein CCAX7_55180 [Capsulimonas corticalis]